MVKVSVIIPTKNRAQLFAHALQSVASQHYSNLEIIVIDDGSSEQEQLVYQQLIDSQTRDVTYIKLVKKQSGHGPSYSRNFGVANASGEYVAFLDDDDTWIDNDYLTGVMQSIQEGAYQADAVYSNQHAFHADGSRKNAEIWIEDLTSRFSVDRIMPLTTEQMLSSNGFAHLNGTLLKKTFFDAVGGLDESLCYEEDRDFYYRSIDQAETILFNPNIVARHNIPDRSKTNNASTAVGDMGKILNRLSFYEKNIVKVKHQTIRERFIQGKVYEYKNLAMLMKQNDEPKLASLYAKHALANRYSLKWGLYTLYLSIVALKSSP
jgi:glycosyltransferase involved in cell wall biosynthesis